MTKISTVLIFSLLSVSLLAADDRGEAKLRQRARILMQNQLVKFLENKGQMKDLNGNPVPFVLYKAEAPAVNLFITEQGLTIQTLKIEEEDKKDVSSGMVSIGEEDASTSLSVTNEERAENSKTEWERVDVNLYGARISKENITKEGEGATNFNFFYPHCSQGIYGVKEYEKVTIKNIYPGIDWVLYNTNDKGFKYDFVVRPGGDYKLIKLLYRSKKPIRINERGEIVINTLNGDIAENAPVSFLNGAELKTRFIQNYQRPVKVNGDDGYETSISFDLHSDLSTHNSQLIIDPQLVWATFYGGSGLDGPTSVTTDAGGNVFVTGYTGSANFPVQAAGTYFQGALAGGSGVFILKFSNTGNRLWATYYGGSGGDAGWSITTDAAGNVFVTGEVGSANFPVQNTGTYFQGILTGVNDIFILKFDNNGIRLWATYYGGNGRDIGYSIITDNSGNIFITGNTTSTNFPVCNGPACCIACTPGYFQSIYAGGSLLVGDAFVLKFDNSGNRLWATYYGGSDRDVGYSIATDGSGNIFVTGETRYSGFPVCNGPACCATCTLSYSQGAAGGRDAFILKFDNNGNRLWATYYGGVGDDYGYTIDTDGSGNVFVTGSTASADFPVCNGVVCCATCPSGYFDGVLGGSSDAFILKFDNNGNRLWATYYGGAGIEGMFSYDNLTIDSCGNVYMSFNTYSVDMPVQSSCDGEYQDNSHNGPVGNRDIALVFFNNSGNCLWATYLGGNGIDVREALAVDGSNNLFMAGEWTSVSNSATYPLTDPGSGAYFDATFNGGDDGYLIKFTNSIIANTSTNQSGCGSSCAGSAAVNVVSPSACIYTYLWTNGNTTDSATGLCAGTYTVTVTNYLCKSITLTAGISGGIGTLTLTLTQANSTCSSSGIVTAQPAGGIPNYTYLWLPSGGSSATATGLSAGTYTVTVTDAVSCIATASVTIISALPLAGQFAKGTADCIGCGCKEWIMVTATGGTSPYTYTWPDGYVSRYKNQLCPGAYSINIKDKNGCSVNVNLTAP
ncbi:MAG: SBBP repeat-containing protein [Bacteroidetes bacterium]|nr:SBBP repeat-containing protein [Bacteroidota bacterium]